MGIATILFNAAEKTTLGRVLERAKDSGRPEDNAEDFKERYAKFFYNAFRIMRYFRSTNRLIEVNSALL